MQRDHRLHSQQEVDVVVDGKVRIPQRVKAQMKEHIDDAPMRLVEKLNKEDRKIADARAWRVAFKAWKKSLTRAEKGPRAYESIADLRDWARRNEMPPPNSGDSDAPLEDDKLVVLRFSEEAKGVVFTTMGLFRTLRLAETGSLPLCLVTDGTHKIHYGKWVLLTLGTHSIEYDMEKYALVHSFRPISFCFAQEEDGAAMTLLFQTTMDTHKMLYGSSPNTIGCWIHVLHKFQFKKGTTSVNGRRVQVCRGEHEWKVCELCVKVIHSCRSEEQAQAVGTKLLQVMARSAPGPVARWFEDNYLGANLDWWSSASTFVGVPARNNSMEGWHNAAKNAFPKGLRNPTDSLMEKHFPKWLEDETYKRGTKSINPAFRMELSTDVHFAVDYLQAEGSHMEVDEALYVVGDPFKIGTRSVTRAAVLKYRNSLAGNVGSRPRWTIQAIERDFLFLNRVTLQNGQPRCDCERFWLYGICSHQLLWARESPGGNGYGGSISFRLPCRGRQWTQGEA
eukprot:jgi/Tetstr1/440447/TSEL_003067.t1